MYTTTNDSGGGCLPELHYHVSSEGVKKKKKKKICFQALFEAILN